MGGRGDQGDKSYGDRAAQYRPVKWSVSSSNQLFLARRACGGRRQHGVLVSAKQREQGSGKTNSSPNTRSWLKKKQLVIWSSFSAAC